jgi:hypothetical protein
MFTCHRRKLLQQLVRERAELDRVYNIAESVENRKHDDDKVRKLQELIQVKGKQKCILSVDDVRTCSR